MSYEENRLREARRRTRQVTIFGTLAALLIVGGIPSCMYAMPKYGVYQQTLKGTAELARAEQNRTIRIEVAKAELEASKLDAAAEIERAKGVAEANAIIADNLGGPEGYLRYLWINKLGENQQDVIYIPTEAGMPILEAGKRND